MNHAVRGARFKVALLILFTSWFFPGCGGDGEQVVADLSVHFADARLEAAVREAVQKLSGSLFPWDLTGLAALTAEDEEIANLDGIEYCVNLTELDLSRNNIADIGPIRTLGKLTILELDDNSIVELDALEGISDLRNLLLRRNHILRIDAVADLTNLTLLALGDNRISEIGPLGGLLVLTSLGLEDNEIEDIAPLAQNASAGGLGTGDSVNLSGNPLSPPSVEALIPYLEGKGVAVTYP